MIDEQTENSLRRIFNESTGWGQENLENITSSPYFNEMASLARLLDAEPREEALQQFLTKHPQFLQRMSDYGDRNLAFLTKPPIGTQRFADFALLSVSQGGAAIFLYEIEPSAARLFIKDKNPAKKFRIALGQVRDWFQIIEGDKGAFVSDMVRRATEVPRYPERAKNGSFRLCEAQDINNAWSAFSGWKYVDIISTVIIGRWSSLSANDRENLISFSKTQQVPRRIFTYDQLIRRAYAGPEVPNY